MVQQYTPKPADERPSNNLGVREYLQKQWLPWALIFGGGAIGYTLGKMGKHKYPFFDGKQPFVGLFERGSKRVTGEEIETYAEQREFFDKKWSWLFGSERGAANFRQNTWNIVKGVSLPAVYFAFTNWREEEGTQIGLYEIEEGIREVEKFHQTNDDLRLDNETIKKQIDHLREKRGEAPLFKVDEAMLDGLAKEVTSLEVS